MNDRRTDPADRAAVLLALATDERPALAGVCPDPERILAWHEEMLDAGVAADVQRHVAGCEHCRTLHVGLSATAAPAPARADEPQPWWQRLFGTGRPLVPALGGAAVAAMAALVLVNTLVLAPGPIPDYSLIVQGQSLARGAETPADPLAVELRDGNQFQLLLRPETALDEDVGVALYVLTDEGLRDLRAPPARQLPGGVVLVEGLVGGDVQLPPGEVPLLVVVGRADELPDARTLQRRLIDTRITRTRHWSAWRVDVRHPD